LVDFDHLGMMRLLMCGRDRLEIVGMASAYVGKSNNGRARSTDKAYMRAIASLPRQGRIIRQLSRCFIVNPRPTMKDLRNWAYPGRKREHWHYRSIYRALRDLGSHARKS
jgi:hypothetical protein